MTEVTVLLAGVFSTYMTWRGYRRGAMATVAGWIPALLTLGVLVLTCWRRPGSVPLMAGGVAAATVFLVGVLSLRACRRWWDRRGKSASFERTSRRWLRKCDRTVGAGLGLLCSAVACLGLACLGSLLPFAYSVSAQDDDQPDDANEQPPAWVAALSDTCRTLAEFSDTVVLHHVTPLREYGQEMRALVTILNAPRADLELAARINGLTNLLDVPSVKAALDDKHYAELFLSLKEGNIGAVAELIDSPITRELIESPEIRELTSTLTPTSLADDLTQIETRESQIDAPVTKAIPTAPRSEDR